MSMKQRRSSFGKWLKERREAAQLTQLDLAKQLHYENPQIISNIERGFSALPSRRVNDFAAALRCSGLELELRRVLSSCKDESSVEALEIAIAFVPLIEQLSRDQVKTSDAILAINACREKRALPAIQTALENVN